MKRSIKTKLRAMVLIISASALLITSLLGVWIMMMIRTQSETSLINETRSNLTDLVQDRAELTEEKLRSYREATEFFALCMGDAYSHPDEYIPGKMLSSRPDDPDEYMFTTIRRDPRIDLNDYIDELQYGYGFDTEFRTYMENAGGIISVVYWGDENGLLSMYDRKCVSVDPSEIYDFWDSTWYSQCKKQRRTIFTDIYYDKFGAGLTLTCATPIYKDNGEFIGVFGIDVKVSDFYEQMVALNKGDGSYVFLMDSRGNVIRPDSDAIPLSVAEGLDEDSCQRLLDSDGAVFERNGNYYTGAKIPSTGWTLCIHSPADNNLLAVHTIDNEILTAIIAFIIVFVVMLAIVAFVSNGFASDIADPIIALKEDVAGISEGDLDRKAEVRTDDEIGELAKSVNGMSESLKAYIENIRHMTANQERLSAELSVAAKIQSDMLPAVFPAFPDRKDFDVYATMTPAREVGGDFYDFFLTDDDHLALVIADVSGKGVPAALFMVITKTLIKNHAMGGEDPASILKNVNRQLSIGNEEMLFVTAWIGIITLSTGEMICADAGHEYPALYRVGSPGFELIKGEHFPPLGTDGDNEYIQTELKLNRGDSLFVYTDGLTDVKDPMGTKYGIDRVVGSLAFLAGKPPRKLVTGMMDNIDGYRDGCDPFDDITMMCVQYRGPLM